MTFPFASKACGLARLTVLWMGMATQPSTGAIWSPRGTAPPGPERASRTSATGARTWRMIRRASVLGWLGSSVPNKGAMIPA